MANTTHADIKAAYQAQIDEIKAAFVVQLNAIRSALYSATYTNDVGNGGNVFNPEHAIFGLIDTAITDLTDVESAIEDAVAAAEDVVDEVTIAEA